MKKFVFILMLLFSKNFYAQVNLVPNPSFEDTLPHNGCITGIEVANRWFNPNSSSPDLFSYRLGCVNSSLNNPDGYQLPKSGFCYTGIFTWDAREYIAVKLDSALSFGCSYYIEFYVSKADNFKHATDKIGCAFMNDTSGLYLNGPGYIPLITAIESQPGILITNDSSWIRINGTYSSFGGEQFLLIGNFYNDSNTYVDTVAVAPFNGAYYYIDDVKILPCGLSAVYQNNKENLISIQQISFSNKVKITFNFESVDVYFLLTDAIGKVHSRQRLRCKNEQDILVEVSDCATGIYFATVVAKNFTITKKITIKNETQ